MEEPYHVFVFRYRPEGPYFDVHFMFVLTLVLIAMLRAQGISVVSSSAALSANNNLAPSGGNTNEGGSQSNKRALDIEGTLPCIPTLANTDSCDLSKVKQDSDDSEGEEQADLQVRSCTSSARQSL